MPSPADRQTEATEDVERIAKALFGALGGLRWEGIGEKGREFYRVTVRGLLHRDVIRVGNRPRVERPMEGQTTIEDCVD